MLSVQDGWGWAYEDEILSCSLVMAEDQLGWFAVVAMEMTARYEFDKLAIQTSFV